MTLKTADRVFETSTTIGTGTLTLLGPVSGFQAFVTGVGNGAKVPYTITQANLSGVIISWECGIGTVTDASPDTLARNTVLRSSNADAPVAFGSGTKNVYLGFIADVVPTRDENLNFIEHFGVVGGTANALTLTLPVAPKGYSDGMIIRGFATANNITTTTINVNSLGVKTVKLYGADLPANTLVSGSYFEGVYKSSTGFFELQGIAPAASATVAGVIELATDAEFQTGTATDRGVTPANAKNSLGFSKSFTGTAAAIAASVVQAHGLGAVPKLFQGYLVCTSAEKGYAVGDIVNIPSQATGTGNMQFSANATNVYFSWQSGTAIQITNRDGSTISNIDTSKWNVLMRAWA
jgi:hypothetical protein